MEINLTLTSKTAVKFEGVKMYSHGPAWGVRSTP